LARLPDAYAQALRGVDCGTSDDEMCSKLDIELEALPALLDIAHRKLRTELTRE
jgi:hypothetical protein